VARPRDLTENDLATWGAFVRHVRALPGRSAPEAVEIRPRAVVPQGGTLPQPRPVAQRFAVLVIGEQPPGVDNATWRRLRNGRLGAERSLDLHGHTAQRGFVALELLLRGARADGIRVVEVITGRGAGEGGGVLKRELPLWLNLPHLRPMILAAVHPTNRNTGAVRLLLRR
jgi:DNA-nicking Smr family endonuclease